MRHDLMLLVMCVRCTGGSEAGRRATRGSGACLVVGHCHLVLQEASADGDESLNEHKTMWRYVRIKQSVFKLPIMSL